MSLDSSYDGDRARSRHSSDHLSSEPQRPTLDVPDIMPSPPPQNAPHEQETSPARRSASPLRQASDGHSHIFKRLTLHFTLVKEALIEIGCVVTSLVVGWLSRACTVEVR